MSEVVHAKPETPAWRVVAGQELRDLWLTGRGLPLLVGYTLLLSTTSYLTASNRALNFLEQRETVGTTLQVAVGMAALLVLVVAADSISGERDRGTLENLLTTPAPRRAFVVGKGLAALSLWGAAYVASVPYVWYLGRGTRVTGAALIGGFVVGLVLAIFAAALGLLLSIIASSSRFSLATSVFVLLALFAPTQIPSNTQQAWFGDLLLHVDPFTSGLRYLGKLVVNAAGFGHHDGWLIGPIAVAAVMTALVLFFGERIKLQPGSRT